MDASIAIPEWQILGDPGLGTLSFSDSVLDTPLVNTRAGLYVYLNALLLDRPSFDDDLVLNFLNARYREDVPGLVSDLILASFDILANATYRNESARSVNIIRSFLVNKLPPFLRTNYAALLFEPLTMEQCIRQAFGRIDPAAFPSFSQMFDLSSSSSNSVLSEARPEFLFACALHQLIQEQSIEEILGDVPMQSLPAGGRYVKDDLVTQYIANSSKVDQFVGELENMEGNAGEIANAVVEYVHTLCANNDTVTLKGVCNSISRKPVALDIIMLFTNPVRLLQPVCSLLDSWQEQEEQGEHQPVYDEFGSILLFVVAIKQRFNLKYEEFGLASGDSYVRKYFRTSSNSRSLNELSKHEMAILGAWIKDLFETEVISDELMSMCKPKEFHLLVTTLFDQSIKARQNGSLSFEKLKGGFDFLLEPFLLPSLSAGLTWFAHRLSEVNRQANKLDVMLPVLHALLRPNSMSHDSSVIHGAIISAVAKPLKLALNQLKKDHPSRSDIAPLIQTLNPSYDERPGYQALKELSTWSVTPHGGLRAALGNTMSALVVWSATSVSSTDMSPPSYTHRQVEETISTLGAKTVFDLFLQEALTQDSSSSNQELLLDCFIVIIVASQHRFPPENQGRSPCVTLDLNDILQLYFQDVNELSQSDPARATILVRIHRRVEALMGRKGENVVTSNRKFMDGVVSNVDELTATNIDDVIAEAQNDMNSQVFLSGDDAALLGMA